MFCNKKSFDSSDEASRRASEINSENKKSGRVNKNLRPYKCDKCGKHHLSSMTKHEFKWSSNVEYRNRAREEAFVKRETEHWERKFGVLK